MTLRERLTQVVSGPARNLVEERIRTVVVDVLHDQDLVSSGEVEALRRRFQELEQRTATLEQRIATLEHHAEETAHALAEARSRDARPAVSSTPAKSADGAVCQVPGCGGVYRSKGFCSPHYQRWRRGTLPGFVRTDGTVPDGARRWKVGVEHAGSPVEVTGPEDARVVLVRGKPVPARAV
ncbi:MAG: hypothetical protein JXB39_13095 [Deltaproteobacteria bacterium]|nr:hypothetical protein [Deltaproteobacteria bacterium]